MNVVKTGRGRFRFEAEAPLQLEEGDPVARTQLARHCRDRVEIIRIERLDALVECRAALPFQFPHAFVRHFSSPSTCCSACNARK